MLEVVIAAAVAWVALDEALPPVQLAGGPLILVGVVLAETARREPDRAAEDTPGDTPVTTPVT